MVNKLLKCLTKKELQIANKTVFRVEKIIKKEETNSMSTGKTIRTSLIGGLIKTCINIKWVVIKNQVVLVETT